MLGEKNENQSQVTILGARGSVPVSGAQFSRYGTATACVLLETASAAVIFDAGTGMMNLPKRVWKQHKKVHLFLSHFHIDHLLGALLSPILYDGEAEVVCYTSDVEKLRQALGQMMEKPLWPVGTESYDAKITYKNLGASPYRIEGSPVTVSYLPVKHPGGALAYRAEWGEHSMVYATDCELDEQGSRELEAFAGDTELFILDAQYTKEEYGRYQGYGHSSVEDAATVIAKSGAGQGLLFHHAPNRTDQQLAEIETMLQQQWNHIGIAKEGDKILL